MSECLLQADFQGFYQTRDPLFWGASLRSFFPQMFAIKLGERKVEAQGYLWILWEHFSHLYGRAEGTQKTRGSSVMVLGVEEGQSPKFEIGRK